MAPGNRFSGISPVGRGLAGMGRNHLLGRQVTRHSKGRAVVLTGRCLATCDRVQRAAERGLDAGCWDVGSVWQLEFKLSLNLILCLICELQIKTTFAAASGGFAGLSD